MYKLCFYVPGSHLEPVKKALFEKGAGKLGNYDCCAWQTLGEGQFKPLENNQPFIGKAGEITMTSEYQVEMICEDAVIHDVVHALIDTHPYEEPAYAVWKLETIK